GIIALCWRRNVFGYGAAIGIAAFWNTMNLFATTFIRDGVEEYAFLIRNSHLRNPEMLVSPIAALAHFGMIFCALDAYALRNNKSTRDLWMLTGGACASVGLLFLD